MSRRPRVAVVGAGLAGLSAAVALARDGAHVEIFERTRLLGGKATSFTVDGIEVDNGQHVVLACCSEFLDFAESLGMSDSLWMQPRFEVLVLRAGARPGRLAAAPLPPPLHLAASFLRYRFLPLRDKLRVARALAAARSEPPAEEDMAAWLRRHGQTQSARDAFWDPFLVPAVNAPLESVSAADGLFVVRTAFLSSAGAARIAYMTVPLARLAEVAAERADAVHLRMSVTGLLESGGRVTGVRTDAGEHGGFDACIMAIPPRRLNAVLGDAVRYGVAGLLDFRTQPIVDVHLWYAGDGRRLLGDAGFAALLRSPVQWVFEKYPGYLCCSLSAASEHVTLPEHDLTGLCHEALAAALPPLRARPPTRSAVTRDADATFVPAPGLRRLGPSTAIPNLALAGAWTDTGWPATMESAVRSGRRAAAVVMERAARAPAAAPRTATEMAHAH